MADCLSSALLSHEKKVPHHSLYRFPLAFSAAKHCHIPHKMASYDTDSSDDADSIYTVTNVLLGYASKEAKEDTISHLGGRPVCSAPFRPSFPMLICAIFNEI